MAGPRTIGVPGFICAWCRRSTLRTHTPSLVREYNQTATRTAPRRPAKDAVSSMLPRAPVRKEPQTMNSKFDYAALMDQPPPDPSASRGISPFPTPMHRMHCYFTKHNTHMTFTAPVPVPPDYDPYKPLPQNQPKLAFSTGLLGFKKAARGTYDAAYQLASYTLRQITERDMMRDIQGIELVLRGFGPGRDAVLKAILGQEGRFVKPLLTKVSDATRLKFGGARSPKPRRLG